MNKELKGVSLGDFVKVTDNINGHGFEVGDVLEVVIIDEDCDDYACMGLGSDAKRISNCWMQKNEFKLLNKYYDKRKNG